MDKSFYFLAVGYVSYKFYQYVKKEHHLRFFSKNEWNIIHENLTKINVVFSPESEFLYPKDKLNQNSPEKFDVTKFKNLIPLLAQLKEIKKTSEIFYALEAYQKFIPLSVRNKLKELKDIKLRSGQGSMIASLNDTGDIEFSVDYQKNQLTIRLERTYSDETMPSWDSHRYIYKVSLPTSEFGNAKLLAISRIYDAQEDHFFLNSSFYTDNKVLLKNIIYHFSAYGYDPLNETHENITEEKIEQYKKLKVLIEKEIESFKVPNSIVMKLDELEKKGFPDF